MDIVYQRGRATAAEIHEQLPDPPCAAAVRTQLRILEDKGHLRHEKEGPRHIYYPTVARSVAQRSAVKHLLGTFFNGSRAAAVAALLEESDRPLSSEERQQITHGDPALAGRGQIAMSASAGFLVAAHADSARIMAAVYSMALVAALPIVAAAAAAWIVRRSTRGRARDGLASGDRRARRRDRRTLRSRCTGWRGWCRHSLRCRSSR